MKYVIAGVIAGICTVLLMRGLWDFMVEAVNFAQHGESFSVGWALFVFFGGIGGAVLFVITAPNGGK